MDVQSLYPFFLISILVFLCIRLHYRFLFRSLSSAQELIEIKREFSSNNRVVVWNSLSPYQTASLFSSFHVSSLIFSLQVPGSRFLGLSPASLASSLSATLRL